MATTPPAVNPDFNHIADQAKHGYAEGTELLAATQFRLSELGGTGRLDPDESMRLQDSMVDIWEALYFGTVCAVRDGNTDDWTWADTDNTYSDGREVMTLIQIEPRETQEDHWEYKLNGDGAVNAHPRGTICGIAPIRPE